MIEPIKGEEARLIPVVADTSREQRITSVTLAMMTQIPELSRRLLETVGMRLGKRASVTGFTEVRLPGATSGERPDGLLKVWTGKAEWTAVIEAKIGANQLCEDQLNRYVDLAIGHGIDAVITISNEFTAQADHHPTLMLNKHKAKKVALFHWPWNWVRTQARLIELDKSVDDPEQAYLLNEFLRYLDHPSTGVESFSQMPKEWRDVVAKVKDGDRLRKTAPEVEAVVGAWQQEVRDLTLQMSELVGRKVDLRLARAERDDPMAWFKSGCEELASNHSLSCSLQIPDTAGPVHVHVCLQRRTIKAEMRVRAPEDKKSTKARVNWLLRQIKAEDTQVMLRAIRPGKAENVQKPVADLREDPCAIEVCSPDIVPTAFDVVLVQELTGNQIGSRKFIQALEELVPAFYEQAVQFIKAWQAPPPKALFNRDQDDAGEEEEQAVLTAD